MAMTEKINAKLLVAAFLAALVVAAATVGFLSKGLPDQSGKTLQYPVASLNFAFGSGHIVAERMLVDEFANGYALLSSGPVSIQADTSRVLSYTWLPPKMPQEAAFFWRRSNNPQNIYRTEISAPGAQLLNLATEADWKGEISEIGFLLAGVNGQAVELGEATLKPDNLATRLELTWWAWTAFEEWSQQSINFLHGGDYRQIVALPLLIASWLLITLLLHWLFSRLGKKTSSRQLLISAGLVFLIAWLMLDLRWTANNLHQIRLSLQTRWQADDQQRSIIDLDGEIYQYVQRLKNDVLGTEPARILILGDENAIDYYLLRAKYHLLPHSVNVSTRFASELKPGLLDFVIFFGDTTSIIKTPDWGPSWQMSLVAIDRGQWGVVYRVE